MTQRSWERDAMRAIELLADAKCFATRREVLTATSAVYFLKLRGEVVYVGQSTNVIARIIAHSDKEYDEAIWIKVPTDLLDNVEGFFIHLLRPRLNFGAVRGRLNSPYSDLWHEAVRWDNLDHRA